MTFRFPAGGWRREKGLYYEQLAFGWLRRQGLRPLLRNYRCPMGEIDLVMLDDDTLVFVEVRYRALHSHGEAFETVDRRKQRKLLRSARHFLLTHREHATRACRFDVLGISGTGTDPDYQWLRGAFDESC